MYRLIGLWLLALAVFFGMLMFAKHLERGLRNFQLDAIQELQKDQLLELKRDRGARG